MFKNSSIIVAACFVSCVWAEPHFSITQPQGDTIDRPISIIVDDLPAYEPIELHAEVTDKKNEKWTSRAVFLADRDGVMDVSKQKPLKGSSYAGIDDMGLIWSMKPASNDLSSSFKCKDDAFIVTFTFLQEDQVVGQQTLTRYLKSPEIQRIDVREEGLVGTLFVSPSKEPCPVIIVLNGSNGGLGESPAKLFASNGYAAFALGYFGVEGLPSNLQDIPLEYFERAFAWLKKRSDVDGSKVGIYGVSRGGELALLLASQFPDAVQAVAAIVPSSVVNGGLGEKNANAWLYHGRPVLPFAPVPKADFSHGKGDDAAHAITIRENFLAAMEQKEAYAAAAIPVEKIRCPIFIAAGGDDQMWPSAIFAEQIEARLDEKKSNATYSIINYDCAGHGIALPNLPIPETIYFHPVSKKWFTLGGSREDDAFASRDSWSEMLEFLKETFSESENAFDGAL